MHELISESERTGEKVGKRILLFSELWQYWTLTDGHSVTADTTSCPICHSSWSGYWISRAFPKIPALTALITFPTSTGNPCHRALVLSDRILGRLRWGLSRWYRIWPMHPVGDSLFFCSGPKSASPHPCILGLIMFQTYHHRAGAEQSDDSCWSVATERLENAGQCCGSLHWVFRKSNIWVPTLWQTLVCIHKHTHRWDVCPMHSYMSP